MSEITDSYIVADVGGTNARFALVDAREQLSDTTVLTCADYPSINDAIEYFIEKIDAGSLSGICMAVAGPVSNDAIDLLNSHWSFSQSDLAQRLNCPLIVINDFTAQALCLDLLGGTDIEWLGQARPQGNKIRVVVGPGTGLGVSAIMPDGYVVPSEGGHIGFAPTTSHQVDLFNTLSDYFSRVSVERVVSGQGLENIFRANARLRGVDRRPSSKDITQLATNGDELALESISDFYDILATVAGDLALLFWAEDGVYLSGGMMKNLNDFFDAERFRSHFEAKGRFDKFCESVPVAVIRAEHPGLLGCCATLKNKP